MDNHVVGAEGRVHDTIHAMGILRDHLHRLEEASVPLAATARAASGAHAIGTTTSPTPTTPRPRAMTFMPNMTPESVRR